MLKKLNRSAARRWSVLITFGVLMYTLGRHASLHKLTHHLHSNLIVTFIVACFIGFLLIWFHLRKDKDKFLVIIPAFVLGIVTCYLAIEYLHRSAIISLLWLFGAIVVLAVVSVLNIVVDFKKKPGSNTTP